MASYQRTAALSKFVRKQRESRLEPIFKFFQDRGYEISIAGFDIYLTGEGREIYFHINNYSTVLGREDFVYVEVVESGQNFEVAELRRINLLDPHEKTIRNLERRISTSYAWATV